MTLSPNCCFDSQRWDRQSKGEATDSSGTALFHAQAVSVRSVTQTAARIFTLSGGQTNKKRNISRRWRRFPKADRSGRRNRNLRLCFDSMSFLDLNKSSPESHETRSIPNPGEGECILSDSDCSAPLGSD